jgi:transcriptional regulator with XRE-family HTH domain
MTIGQRIREVRRQREKTLKQLAEDTGLSLTYLSDVERGDTQPSLKSLQRIAEGLDLTTTDLMRGVDNLSGVRSDVLPPGLRELREDPRFADQLTGEWIETLLRVDYRGRRPESKREWQNLFMLMQSILDPDEET